MDSSSPLKFSGRSDIPPSMTKLEIPQSFKDMPRWWDAEDAEQEWLDTLPEALNIACQRWNLHPDGAPLHGSNAIVLPVIQSESQYVPRMTPPGDVFEKELAALRFWDGRATVKLIDAEPSMGAMILERLDISRTLADVPLKEAVPITAQLMRRLALPIENDKDPLYRQCHFK